MDPKPRPALPAGTRRVAARLLPVALALLGAACTAGERTGGPPPSADPPQRIFLVGIDAASWDDLEPLIDAGQLPNLARLRDAGARGVLRSFHPTASSILWTSIATGKVPERHGIRGFVAPLPGGERVPVTSNMRTAEAIWNILSAAGIPVGVIGWWVTWPAEEVLGFLASDYTWPLKKDRRGFAIGRDPNARNLSHRTYPETILEEIEPYLVTPESLPPVERVEMGLDRIPPTGSYAVAEILCKDRSYMDGGLYLLDRYRPPFFAVYLEGIDAFKHLFWKQHRAFRLWRYGGGGPMPPRPDRAVAGVLEIQYRRIDGFLGALIERAGPDTTIAVVSDHGYGDNPGRAAIERTYGEMIEPEHWHDLDGILLLYGGAIRAGIELPERSVLDVTPTLLALMGLPVGDDMDGKVIVEAIRPEFLERHPLRSVPTHETGRRTGGVPIESPFAQEMLELLRSLGYLDRSGD